MGSEMCIRDSFMGFSFMPLVFAAYYGNDNGARGQFYSEVFDPPGMVAAAGVAAPLTDLGAVIEEAESVWGENRIATIDIRNPGDSQARIFISENFDQTVAAGAGRLFLMVLAANYCTMLLPLPLLRKQ